MNDTAAETECIDRPEIVQRVRGSYIIGLGIIALLLVSLEFVNQSFQKAQERDAYLVNIAGRQRMLSQRICELVLLYRQFPDDYSQAKLDSLLEQWTKAHGEIAGYVNTPEARDFYQGLTPLLEAVKGLANPKLNNDQIKSLISASDQFLGEMEKMVGRFELEAQGRVERQNRRRIFIILIILLALILEARLIFQPLVSYLEETLEKLQEANIQTRRALNETAKAERNKSDFLANVSHEIRTPMNAICGLSALALKREVEPKLEDYLVKINSSAHSLLGILNDILDVSKIEAGKLELEQTEFELDGLISHLAGILGTQAVDVGLELFFAKEPEVPSIVVGDSLRLGQILINLVNNAVKFTPEGEVVVRIGLEERADDRALIRFSVTDTGIGMTPEQVNRLFQAFTQAEVSTARKYGGTGLGLVISKNLVELMGGTISVESEVGVGTTFSFSISFGLSEKSKKLQFSPDENLLGLQVLVVDNSATSREVLSEMLESFCLSPVAVDSGQAALKYLAEHQVDLVLIDWQMPGMDGMETSRAILERVSPAPRVVMVTAYGREFGLRKADKIGLTGFLEKPLTSSSLYDAVASAMGAETIGKLRPSRPGVRYDFKRVRVLVVEDNAINQQVAREFLESMNLHVTIAQNGREALDVLRSEDFAVVLMDVQMPEMDGYEATAEIRKDDKLRGLPVVAMTAHAMASERIRTKEAGMDDHLIKPIDPQEVVRVLSRWVEVEISTAPEEPGPEPLLQLQEIDLKVGLRRAGDNVNLYLNLLGDLKRKFGDVPMVLNSDTASFREKEILAHTLRGVAANLGAEPLAKAATDLELALKEKRTGQLKKLLEVLEKTLSATLHEVDLAVKALKEVSASDEGGESLSRKRIDHLIEYLKQGNVDAISIIESTERQSLTPEQDALFSKLAALVDEFDFDGALVAARDLRETLSACA